ncbi:hypothetical protein AVEN_212428-1 [Araneus ventricosus]|uniref:Uncharacterized protein n=1 Tax=Araneus ventricosus TaxID=182803 RepID=A0A4Y2S1Q3_ARAVE|nr:hypothetical protein AVEN_212428-1 [Araneus ventricosus]
MIENSEEYPHFCLELALAGERRLRQYPVGPIVNEFVPLEKIKGLRWITMVSMASGRTQPRADHEELMELYYYRLA